jgi:lipoate-protein ligase B
MLEYAYIGRVSYDAGLQTMESAFARVKSGACDGVIIGLTHDPVMTLGLRANSAHLLISEGSLRERGVSIVRTERGGDITYHGPEQVLLYPVLALDRLKISVKDYSQLLERVMSEYLRALSVTARTVCGAPGVYVGEKKIGFVGLRIKEGISQHGLALNLTGSLQPFSWMNPCGHAGLAVTSVERERTGGAQTHEAAARGLAQVLVQLIEARATGGLCEDSRVSGQRAVP